MAVAQGVLDLELSKPHTPYIWSHTTASIPTLARGEYTLTVWPNESRPFPALDILQVEVVDRHGATLKALNKINEDRLTFHTDVEYNNVRFFISTVRTQPSVLKPQLTFELS